ncbi:MAG: DUF2071 domain-containing protein [bacterium]|nr:DUF2071 domain-containing protein [bacterium]
MHQIWEDLLFAHYEVDADRLRSVVPSQLPLDLFEGKAYIAVVPFRMRGIRPRYFPAVPWLSAFAELNVRTYVQLDGRPGVYFFSLDAANPVGVWLGYRWFHLPYRHARMQCEAMGPDENDGIRYYSHRTHRGAPAADFVGDYGPTGPVYAAQPGSLEHWLTERYCLYAIDPRGRVHRGEIHHAPWPLQPARAQISVNTMSAAYNLAEQDLPGNASGPLLHFARSIDVVVWPPTVL